MCLVLILFILFLFGIVTCFVIYLFCFIFMDFLFFFVVDLIAIDMVFSWFVPLPPKMVSPDATHKQLPRLLMLTIAGSW